MWRVPGVLCALACAATAATAPPPHIIFILADDLGWNDVGFHGMNHAGTPNIDALAGAGRPLQRLYTPPVCTPARAALMTGKYPIHTGMQRGVIYGTEPRGLPLSEKLLPQYLRERGYRTHLVGKWHLGSYKKEYLPMNRGFDSHLGFWTGKIDMYDHTNMERGSWGFDFRRGFETAHDLFGKYATDVYTEEAVRIIKAHRASSPLFLMVSHSAVHSGNPPAPLRAPAALVDSYRHINDSQRQKFAAVLSELDSSVGAVVGALGEASLLENCVIVFSTDNGGVPDGFNDNAGSNYPLRGTKNTLWEGGVRGAGLVWSPLVERRGRGRACEQPLHAADWLPTLYGLAGGNLSALGAVDGVDQWAALARDARSPRDVTLHNIDDRPPSAALSAGHWKLITGTTYGGAWDGWYGPAGREVPYDVERVFRSEAARALSALRLMPDRETFLRLREETTVRCDVSSPAVECAPLRAPCLFHVRDDPCERRNLADQYPERVSALLSELSRLNRTALAPNNAPLAPAADPRFWGRVYTNFADYTPRENAVYL